jgi:hypothetical protein
VHLVTLAMSIGFAIYGPAAARQLGTEAGTLQARAHAVVGQMLKALLASYDPTDPT